MARIRIFLVLVLAVTAGGALSFATYNYVQKGGATKTVSMPTRPVVVAASNLEIGAELGPRTSASSSGRPMPCRRARSATPTTSSAAGVILPVIQNEPILPMKLASKEAGAGLPPAIPPGPARRVGAGERGHRRRRLRAAGHARRRRRRPSTRRRSSDDITSKVILTNVQVLAAGTKIERDTDKDKPIAGDRRDAARRIRKKPSG